MLVVSSSMSKAEAAVREAFRAVTNAVPDPEGVLVQEFVGEGHEVLIGMTEDSVFGPLLVFGLGGVFVELIGDVAFRIHPLTDRDAEDMISEVKSAKLLEGYRGGDPGIYSCAARCSAASVCPGGGSPRTDGTGFEPRQGPPTGCGDPRCRRLPNAGAGGGGTMGSDEMGPSGGASCQNGLSARRMTVCRWSI